MGLENLSSVFTVGLQVPSSTSVTQFESSLGAIDSLPTTNLIDLSIPDTTSIPPTSLAEMSVSNQLTFPILDTFQIFNMAGPEGVTKAYDGYTYDPRTAKPGTMISKNPYSGTSFDDGLGGLFNSVEPYSNAFTSIITPKGYKNSELGNDIIHFGNITNNGGGYPSLQEMSNTYKNSRGVSPLKYIENGEINTNRTIVQSSIPKYSNLVDTTGFDTSPSVTDSYGNNYESQLEGLAWNQLYNSDHTPISDVGHNHGTFVSRDNLDIRYKAGGRGDGFSFIGGSMWGDRGDEPYMVSDIGSDDTKFASREIPIMRSAVDMQRVSKYVTSTEGLIKMLAYPMITTILSAYLTGAHKYQAFWNPLSAVVASMRLVGTDQIFPITRNFPFTPTPQSDQYNGSVGLIAAAGAWGAADKDIGLGRDEDDEAGKLDKSTYSPAEEITRVSSRISTDKTQINFKGAKGDPHTNQEIKKATKLGDKITTTYPNIESSGIHMADKGLPFYFKDLRDGAFVIFRAYLEGINDSISPTWNETTYVGRSEPVYTYQYATREISFTMKMHAGNRQELGMLYKKMNRLTSMCYPEYKNDSQMTLNVTTQDTAVRMKPPLIQLRMGELFGSQNRELTGHLDSLTWTVPDEATWEHVAGRRVPKLIEAQIVFKVIHDEAPSLRFSQSGYGFGINFFGANENSNVSVG